MALAAFLVLFTIECSVPLFYLSHQIYRRKNIPGQSYFWKIIFLLGLICLLLGVDNLGSLVPSLGPYPAFEPTRFCTNFLGHLITTIWFFFCLQYTGRSRYLTRTITWFLMGYTVLGNIAYQATKFYHFSSGLPILDEFIRLFGISAYIKCCVLAVIGIILLIQAYFHVSNQIRHQILVLLGGMCLVVVTVTIFESNLIPNLNPVGVHFAITGLILGIGILYYDLLTFSPVFRERFFGVIESGLIVLNERHQILDLNRSAEDILHLPLDDAFGKKPSEIPGIFPELKEALAGSDLLGGPLTLSIPARSGAAWYKVSMQRDERTMGVEQVYLVVITDITRSILLEKEVADAHEELIREKEKKRRELMYREFFRSHRDAILIIGNNRIIDCNPVAEHLFGNPSGIIGMTPGQLSAPVQDHPDDVPDKLKYYLSQAAGGKLLDFPWVFSTKGGDVQTEVRLSRLVHNEQVLVEMSIRDISLLYAKQQEITNENENQKRILAGDLSLWREISGLIRKHPEIAGMRDRYSLEEIVAMADRNLHQSVDFRGDEKDN